MIHTDTGVPRKPAITGKEISDIRTLIRFIEIFCHNHHRPAAVPFTFKHLDLRSIRKKDITLCPACAKLLRYGLTMRLRCPHDPKPMCKKCPAPCYRGDYRSRIREIMKFSGIYLVKRGRLDMLYHYLR